GLAPQEVPENRDDLRGLPAALRLVEHGALDLGVLELRGAFPTHAAQRYRPSGPPFVLKRSNRFPGVTAVHPESDGRAPGRPGTGSRSGRLRTGPGPPPAWRPVRGRAGPRCTWPSRGRGRRP